MKIDRAEARELSRAQPQDRAFLRRGRALTRNSRRRRPGMQFIACPICERVRWTRRDILDACAGCARGRR
jgi:4-hydroxy-3-methylbut-2-en-1-yl diphosphate synthase IspG/GcpE